MKQDKICKRSFIVAMSLAAVFALAAAWPYAAAAAGPAECGLIGTWYGTAGSPLTWMGVHTPGSTTTKGGMLLKWVWVREDLLTLEGAYPTVTHLSDGRGVWEQTGKGQYKYTWYAYGSATTLSGSTGQPLSAPVDSPLYSVRVSGIAKNTDCNNIAIDFNYEVFAGFVLPQDMSTATLVGNIVDTAEETRVPLTVVPPPTP